MAEQTPAPDTNIDTEGGDVTVENPAPAAPEAPAPSEGDAPAEGGSESE